MSYMDHQRSVSSVSLSTERTEGGVTTETVLGPDGGVNGAIVSASSSGLLVTLMKPRRRILLLLLKLRVTNIKVFNANFTNYVDNYSCCRNVYGVRQEIIMNNHR